MTQQPFVAMAPIISSNLPSCDHVGFRDHRWISA